MTRGCRRRAETTVFSRPYPVPSTAKGDEMRKNRHRRRVGRRVRATVVLALALLLIAVPDDVSGQTPPQVTVAPGPGTEASFLTECDDAVRVYLRATSFVVSRTGDLSGPLSVDYTVQGTAQPGVHYRALPGTVTIPAGQSSAVVQVRVLDNPDRSRLVRLVLNIAPRPAYAVGSAASATIEFASRRDPRLEPVDCNPRFQLLDVAQNRRQTIRLGSAPAPLRTTGADGVHSELKAGSLPPGVSVTQFVMDRHPPFERVLDVPFLGAATRTGVFAATIEVCPSEIVFTCRRANLTVTVVEGPPPSPASPGAQATSPGVTSPASSQLTQLPRTGLTSGNRFLLVLGLLMVTAGAAIMLAAQRLTPTATAHRRP